MKRKDWKRLDELFTISSKEITKKEEVERDKLFDKTKEVDEHPEDWDSPCQCYECMSCGD